MLVLMNHALTKTALFAGAFALAAGLAACSGESVSAADAGCTLSPAGTYTVQKATAISGSDATDAAGALSAGSVFTVSATPTDGGFALSFSLPDGTGLAATSSAAAVGEPGGSHHAYKAGDTIATFAVSGAVQGEILVRATAAIEADVSGATSTNVTTNATASASSGSSTNGETVVTNTSFSASSANVVTPGNSAISASLLFPSRQISATAPGPSGTVSW